MWHAFFQSAICGESIAVNRISCISPLSLSLSREGPFSSPLHSSLSFESQALPPPAHNMFIDAVTGMKPNAGETLPRMGSSGGGGGGGAPFGLAALASGVGHLGLARRFAGAQVHLLRPPAGLPGQRSLQRRVVGVVRLARPALVPVARLVLLVVVPSPLPRGSEGCGTACERGPVVYFADRVLRGGDFGAQYSRLIKLN